MNWRIELYSTEMLAVLRKSIQCLLVLVAVVCVWLGGETFLVRMKLAEKKAEIKQKQETLVESRKLISNARALPTQTIPIGFEAVAAFQSGTERLAQQSGCEIVEYRASKDLLPYVTRFAQDTTEKDWGQVDVSFQLKGSLANIYKVFNGLMESDLPFELNAFELTRTSVDKNGQAMMTARVELRVLTRQGAA